MTDEWLRVVAIAAAAICLLILAAWLGWKILVATWLGAIVLFGFAREQKFVGVAAYVACWVFMFPVMFVASLIVGTILLLADREDRREERRQAKLAD